MKIELFLLHHGFDCAIHHGGVMKTLLYVKGAIFLISRNRIWNQKTRKNYWLGLVKLNFGLMD